MNTSVSFVLPCLNEQQTIATCIEKIHTSLATRGVDYEVVVADNGSTDRSVEIAVEAGARVVRCAKRGYGAAIRCGAAAARGEYLLVADADDSYALHELNPFLDALEGGADMVLGNRFAGGVEPGAMPWLNRYIGNPVLTGLLNLLVGGRVGDAHCGLRGFRKSAFEYMSPQADGMEFASETVVLALRLGLDLRQAPTTLQKDGRDHAPHLRPFRDGWRHAKYLLIASLDRLLVYSGLVFLLLSLLILAGVLMRIDWLPVDESLSPWRSAALLFGGLAGALTCSGAAMMSLSGRMVPRPPVETACLWGMKSPAALRTAVVLLVLSVLLIPLVWFENVAPGLSLEVKFVLKVLWGSLGLASLAFLACRACCAHCKLYVRSPEIVLGQSENAVAARQCHRASTMATSREASP